MAFPGAPWKRGHPAGVYVPRIPAHCGLEARAPGKTLDPNPGPARKPVALRLPDDARCGAT